MMSPARKWATSTQPPVGGRGEGGDEQALAAEERALQALHHAALGARPPRSTPGDVAIMAPDSARSCSLGSRVTRATAKLGLWRISTVHGGPPGWCTTAGRTGPTVAAGSVPEREDGRQGELDRVEEGVGDHHRPEATASTGTAR